MDTQQRKWARRFCSGFVIQIDATFSTNTLKLVYICCIGITNTGKTFPVAFSLAPSESTEAFDEFLGFMNREIWNEGSAPARVALMDQGGGLLASLPQYLPTIIWQLCQWHAVENIKAKYVLKITFSSLDFTRQICMVSQETKG